MSYNPSEPPRYNYPPGVPPYQYQPAPPPPAAPPLLPNPLMNIRLPGPALSNLCFIVAVLTFITVSVIGEISKWDFALVSIAGELALASVAIIFCLLGRFDFKETFSLRKLDPGSVVLCVFIGISGQFAVRFPALLNQWIMQFLGPFSLDIPNPTDTPGRLLLFFAVGVMAPICEEILMRGFVMGGYRRLSFGRTIFYVGLLFGIFHLYPSRFSYTFLLGMALAYLVLVTGSIFSSILAHFGFNLLGGLSPWLLEWLKNINNGRDLLGESTTITFDVVVASIPLSLLAAGIFFLLLRSVTRRAAKRRPELEIGYLGLARNINYGVTKSAGAYYGPNPAYNYGRYGFERADFTGNVYGKPQPLEFSPLSRTWWQLSFVAVFLLFGIFSFTEVAARLNGSRVKEPNPKTPAAVVVYHHNETTNAITLKTD